MQKVECQYYKKNANVPVWDPKHEKLYGSKKNQNEFVVNSYPYYSNMLWWVTLGNLK